MTKLLDAVAKVAGLVSPDKVEAIASQIRRTGASNPVSALSDIVGTPVATAAVRKLIEAWQKTPISPAELASMLSAASFALTKASAEQSIELVWTGPTTPFVAARRTEQAMLQVINTAKATLFITSFVAYDVSSIVKALNEASSRGVVISMLLETSQEYGGSISIDAIGKMKVLVPSARLYAWRERGDLFSDGRVHAKVAVADANTCFVTSANLTGFAMEKNMEAGLLITGGHIPRLLSDHLESLVATKIITHV